MPWASIILRRKVPLAFSSCNLPEGAHVKGGEPCGVGLFRALLGARKKKDAAKKRGGDKNQKNRRRGKERGSHRGNLTDENGRRKKKSSCRGMSTSHEKVGWGRVYVNIAIYIARTQMSRQAEGVSNLNGPREEGKGI